MRLSLRIPLLTLAAVAAGWLGVSEAGCGSQTHGRALKPESLVLDFTPNAVHVGIYTAIARGFDRTEGIRLQVTVPSASTDSIKLLESGRIDFAILDIHDLAIARERGEDIVGLMALVQRPLASVIAVPAVANPRQLIGRTVGITGVPSDTAVLRSIASGAGADPGLLRTVTIGFNTVPDLLAGRVAAATAFWNDEGVALSRQRPGFHVFRVDRYGAPPYPELVLCATRARIDVDSRGTSAVVGALVRGYEAALSDPRGAAADLEARVPGVDPKLLAAELTAVSGALRRRGEPVGYLDGAVLRRWAQWEARFGIVARPPDVAAMFDPRFLSAEESRSGS